MADELEFSEEKETRDGGEEVEEDAEQEEARKIKKAHPETHATPSELADGGNTSGSVP